jgi:hypothetical protein
MTKYEEIFYSDIHQIKNYLKSISESLSDFKSLKAIQSVLIANEELSLYTKNKKNGWLGVASFFTNGLDKIRINEGNPDGSDDCNVSFQEFIDNYYYVIGLEGNSYDQYK